MYQYGFETVSFWKKSKKELLERSLCLFLSLAAHILMLALLVVYYSPIKILDFEGEIRNVFIAPPFERLVLPEQDRVTTSVDVSRTAAEPGPRSGLPAASVERPTPVTASPDFVLPDLSELPSRLVQDFDLRQDPAAPVNIPQGFSFQLAPDRGPPTYDYTPEPGNHLPPGALDKYIYPADPRSRSIPGSRPASGDSRAVSVESQPGRTRADITRWADLSVARILANWFIPLLMTDQQDDEIVIALTVQRDGWIASTEVLQPGRVPELRAAALKALELSVPLPRLPRAYPEKTLNIRIVFVRK